MSIRIIDGRLGLSGQGLKFEKEALFGLEPGQKVIQVGDGRETGTFRTDILRFPIEYVGSIICQFLNQEKMYAFRIIETGGIKEDLFFLYGSTGHELFTECMPGPKARPYVRFYKPTFKIVE